MPENILRLLRHLAAIQIHKLAKKLIEIHYFRSDSGNLPVDLKLLWEAKIASIGSARIIRCVIIIHGGNFAIGWSVGSYRKNL